MIVGESDLSGCLAVLSAWVALGMGVLLVALGLAAGAGRALWRWWWR